MKIRKPYALWRILFMFTIGLFMQPVAANVHASTTNSPWGASDELIEQAHFSQADGAASDIQGKTEEELWQMLDQAPERRDVLEQLAQIFLRRGDFRAADNVYSRLLNLVLDKPLLALHYAVAKWHVRQEYEAHAVLIAASHSGAAEAAKSAKATLSEIYSADGLARMLTEEQPDASRAEAIGEIAKLWKSVLESPSTADADIGTGQSRKSASVLLGRHPTRAFLALWLGYSGIDRGDFQSARTELRIALQSAPDEQTAFNARVGLRLLDNLEKSAPSGDLLNISHQVLAAMDHTPRQMPPDLNSAIASLLGQSEHLARQGDYYGFMAVLAEARRFPMDEEQKGRYLHALGEMWWSLEMYGRAVQSFQGTLAVSTDKDILSDSHFRLASHAARNGDREKAARHALSSAETASDNSWRQREINDILIGLGMEDESASYYERIASASDIPQNAAESYSVLAELYMRIGDRDKFLAAAEKYIGAIQAVGAGATDNEKGRAAYYQGKIFAEANKPDEAYSSYELASNLLADEYKLSEVYMLMAEYNVGHGENAHAAEFAEKSLAVFPDADWKIRQVADFHVRIGMAERAAALYESHLKNADMPNKRAEVLRALAELHKGQDNREQYLRYAGMYSDLIFSPDVAPTAVEEGLGWYYRGEVLSAANDDGNAYAAYAKASRLLVDDFLLSDAYQKLAEYEAERGNRELAAELAEKSVDKLPADWVLRRTGDFLFRQDMPEKAFKYYDRFVKMSDPDDDATAYAIMADAFDGQEDMAGYSSYAGRYVEAVEAKGVDADDAERGLAAYYRGRILANEGKPHEAYRSYEQAVGLLSDQPKLSETYMLMAEYKAGGDEREQAAELAGKSLAVFPHVDWKIRQVADFYLRIGMPDKAFALHDASMGRVDALRYRAEALRELAEMHKSRDNRDEYLRYANMYRDTVASPDFEPTAAEEGLGWYYRGEVLSAANDVDQAFQAYEKATRLLTDDFLLADLYQKLAEYEAERGERERAARFAEKSAEKLPADWVFRRTGDFLLRLDMPEKAFAYYDRFAKASNAADDATAYAIMADAYSGRDDAERYMRYAGMYADAVAAKGPNAAAAEKGLAAYYRGRILAGRGNHAEAYRFYESAAGLLADQPKLSEVYMLMAEYKAQRGENGQAAEFAGKSLAIFPDVDWKIRQAADMYARVGMADKAITLYEAGAKREAAPERRAEAVRELAELHKRLGNRDEYLRYAGLYVDILTASGFEPTAAEAGLGWYYRGEVLCAANDIDQAHQAYEKAARLLTDDALLADLFQRLAEYEAGRGNRELAAGFAEKSADKLPVDWVYRRTGDFLLRLEMPEKALAYYDRFAKTSNPGDDLTAYAIMADAYSGLNDAARHSIYAGRYVEAVAAKGAGATDAEKGLAAYYRGRILAEDGKPDEAYRSYELAADLLADQPKRSEVYMLMAEYQAGRDEKVRATELAEKSLAVSPEVGWKIRQVADFYARLGMPDRAVALYMADVKNADTPKARAEALRQLAELHKRLGNRDQFIHYAGMYRDLVFAPDFAPTAAEEGFGWYYRGEILAAAGDGSNAHEAYMKASLLLTDALLLSDVFQKLAEYEAERGNRDLAAELSEKAAGKLPADWVFRRTGDFLFRLGMPEKAFTYYDRFAKASNPGDDATGYAIMADAYSGQDDAAGYSRYAGRYIEAISKKGVDAANEEMGLAAYYRGRVLADEGRPDDAYRSYEEASRLLADKGKLSEAYRLMAEYKAERGEKDQAAEYAEKALAVFPDEPWLLGYVAGFYVDLERPETGIKHLEDFIVRTRNAKQKAEAYRTIAEIHRRTENTRLFVDYARLYADALADPAYNPTNDENGNRHFYLGEIASMEERPDEANREYELAYGYFQDKFRLSDIAMKRAEYHARRENYREAARLAELSAAHLPNEVWRQLSVAGFYNNVDKVDKAREFFNRSLRLAKTPRERSHVYEALANFHNGKGDKKQYVSYANAFVQAIGELGQKASNGEKGKALYFTGEVHAEMKRPHEAYRAYERATVFVKEPSLLASIYFKMARYHVKHGDSGMAERLALAGVGLLPDKRWIVADAVGILADIKRFDKAEEIALLAIRLDPKNNQGLYQTLALMYFDKAGKRKTASQYHKKYIDHLYARNAKGTQPASKAQREELWHARGAQNGIDRTWGAEVTFSLARWSTGDYWTGTSFQIYRNYRLKNGWLGKMYLQYGGAIDTQFSSYHYISELDTSRYVSRSNLEDTGHLLIGATVNPFKGKWLGGFEVWGEYRLALGTEERHDFKMGAKYGRGAGDYLKPSGNFWHYWKADSGIWYSFEDKVVTSAGEVRQGFTYVNDRDRNLLFSPYSFITYLYDGNNKERHWASDAGLGLMIKKFYREDRYHIPRSTIELDVNYRWPLTRGRDPYLGLSISTSF